MVIRVLLVASLVIAIPTLVAQSRGQTATYVVRGVIRNSSTNVPLANVFIWPGLRRYGVVSDSLGRFAFQWRPGVAHVVRIGRCEQQLAELEMQWLDDSLTQQDLPVPARAQRQCAESGRAPWEVSAHDTTALVGIFTYSWEGGGRIDRCGGKTYRPDWDSPEWRSAAIMACDLLCVALAGAEAHHVNWVAFEDTKWIARKTH